MRITKLLLAGAIASSFIASPFALAESGKFNFKGAITASPCSISGADLDKDINLGVVTAADLGKNAGAGTSIPRDFTVKLENCALTGDTNDEITVTLNGITSQYGTNNFGLDQSGRGAFLVVEKDGTQITPGTATAVQKLVTGNNQLSFTAYIKGAGAANPVVEGDFTATTNVTLAYQ